MHMDFVHFIYIEHDNMLFVIFVIYKTYASSGIIQDKSIKIQHLVVHKMAKK